MAVQTVDAGVQTRYDSVWIKRSGRRALQVILRQRALPRTAQTAPDRGLGEGPGLICDECGDRAVAGIARTEWVRWTVSVVVCVAMRVSCSSAKWRATEKDR
jgi:hypothetical protein